MHFAPGSFKSGQTGELEETPGLSAGGWHMRLLSRGYVGDKSHRPGDAPAINPRYLSEEPDRRAIIGGLRLARRFSPSPRCSRSSGTARYRRGGIRCSGTGPSTISQSVDRSNHSAQF
jgi:choline dehydrogenase-like flavoprotein